MYVLAVSSVVITGRQTCLLDFLFSRNAYILRVTCMQ